MEISDRQVPRQQLLTLCLEGERVLTHALFCRLIHTHTAQTNCPSQTCDAVTTPRSALSAVRRLVAHLCAVAVFARRNLPDGLFQLCHQHFVEHQERVPEETEKQGRQLKSTWPGKLPFGAEETAP